MRQASANDHTFVPGLTVLQHCTWLILLAHSRPTYIPRSCYCMHVFQGRSARVLAYTILSITQSSGLALPIWLQASRRFCRHTQRLLLSGTTSTMVICCQSTSQPPPRQSCRGSARTAHVVIPIDGAAWSAIAQQPLPTAPSVQADSTADAGALRPYMRS